MSKKINTEYLAEVKDVIPNILLGILGILSVIFITKPFRSENINLIESIVIFIFLIIMSYFYYIKKEKEISNAQNKLAFVKCTQDLFEKLISDNNLDFSNDSEFKIYFVQLLNLTAYGKPDWYGKQYYSPNYLQPEYRLKFHYFSVNRAPSFNELNHYGWAPYLLMLDALLLSYWYYDQDKPINDSYSRCDNDKALFELLMKKTCNEKLIKEYVEQFCLKEKRIELAKILTQQLHCV